MRYSFLSFAKGFGLIELFAMIAIVCLVMVHVVSEYKSYARYESMSKVYKQFIYTLSSTRSKAISAQANVAVCASVDGLRCSKTSFAQGWIAFIDNGHQGGNKADRLRNGEELIITKQLGHVAVYPMLTGVDGEELFTIGFSPKGYSSEQQRVIATVADRSRKHIYSRSSKIERSGFISGVDTQRAKQKNGMLSFK